MSGLFSGHTMLRTDEFCDRRADLHQRRRLHETRFGIAPQVMPVLLSQVLYYFESNTRSATVIGIVGAGGIGLYLSNEINQQNWDQVSFLIILILITVTIIDQISSRLRFAIIGQARLA
jgi:phosphonate transport system permease protein